MPTDTTGVNRAATLSLADFPAEDAALSCEQIGRERTDIRQQIAEAEGAIQGNRRGNQTALYLFGALALPVVDTNSTEKDLLVDGRRRLDVLGKVAAVKGCGTRG